jgi:hypothetical protein
MDDRLKLLELKRKILEKTNQTGAILNELKQLNGSMSQLENLLMGIQKIEDISKNDEIVEMLSKLNNGIEKISNVTNLSQIPAPKVIMPSKIEISNIEKAKVNRVGIDWENMPKPAKSSDIVEVRGLDKSLEKIIPKNETPKDVSMEITDNLWEKVHINYPDETINISVNRNKQNIIRGLTFTKG